MSKIGGNGFENGVKNMLRRMLTDELASKYSYLGVRGKKVFRDLKICNIVKGLFVSFKCVWKFFKCILFLFLISEFVLKLQAETKWYI